jgi:hypothetical protein
MTTTTTKIYRIPASSLMAAAAETRMLSKEQQDVLRRALSIQSNRSALVYLTEADRDLIAICERHGQIETKAN